MTQLGLREQKKLRTRRDLRTAAMQLFADEGYDSTTVDDIAERAGVSARTFFRYFATKAEVVFSRDEEHRALLRDAIRQRASSPVSTTNLAPALRAFGEALAQDGDDIRHTASVITQDDDLRAQSMLRLLAWEHELADELARLEGRTRPDPRLEVVAGVALMAFRHAMKRWLDGGRDASLPDILAETLIEVRETV